MAFHDVRLPLKIERGVRGGEVFRTSVISTASGTEQRISEWAQSRREYDLSGVAWSADMLAEMRAFFVLRRGRLHSFRFRDHLDGYVGLNPATGQYTSAQPIGTGTGSRTVWQLVRSYSDAASSFSRVVDLPDLATVRIYLDGVRQTTGFTVSAAGVVTFSVAPGAGVVVSWAGAFDIRVRFDMDSESLSASNFNAATQSIKLVEVTA